MKSKLEEAATNASLVRVYRANFEDGWAEGYVAATGPKFFALEFVDDWIRFNGYLCLRYEDVTECVNPAPHYEFHERALELRGLSRKSWPNIDISGLPLLLETAGSIYPVVTLHTEEEYPDECYIGAVSCVRSTQVDLLEISPDGQWDTLVTPYDLDKITRVDFGGAYEEALVLVANSR